MSLGQNKTGNTPRAFSRRRFLQLAAACGVGATGLGGYAQWLEPGRLVVRRRVVPALGKLRVAHLADLQYKPWEQNRLARLVETLNELDVDLVAITGDFVETPGPLAELLEHLSQVRHPVFAVMGNHDWWAQSFAPHRSIARQIHQGLAKTGGGLLLNRSITVSRDVTLVGLDSLWASKPDPPLALKHTKPEKALILLHEPVTVNLMPDGFLLALGGHTHGGQVRLPFWGAPILPQYSGQFDQGLFDLPQGPLHITAGVGVLGNTPRFNCPPEVVVLSGEEA